jgi:signal transduction histidine kinase
LSFQRKIVRRQYIAIAGVSIILILAMLFALRIFTLNKSNRKAKEDLIKLNAEIKKMNENLESIVQDRTEEIKAQNQKLIDYTFFTAHEVRGPLARILGLIELAKIKELSEEDKMQIMVRLEDASNELDEIIRKVNRKLESTKR